MNSQVIAGVKESWTADFLHSNIKEAKSRLGLCTSALKNYYLFLLCCSQQAGDTIIDQTPIYILLSPPTKLVPISVSLV